MLICSWTFCWVVVTRLPTFTFDDCLGCGWFADVCVFVVDSVVYALELTRAKLLRLICVFRLCVFGLVVLKCC